jgi:hypothetical protein
LYELRQVKLQLVFSCAMCVGRNVFHLRDLPHVVFISGRCRHLPASLFPNTSNFFEELTLNDPCGTSIFGNGAQPAQRDALAFIHNQPSTMVAQAEKLHSRLASAKQKNFSPF